jgi:hypothetical protein
MQNNTIQTEGETELPTLEGIRTAVKSPKKYKAPGMDMVPGLIDINWRFSSGNQST